MISVRSRILWSPYTKALDINPALRDIWMRKGDALNELGRTEDAIAAYTKSLKIDPDQVDGWVKNGKALYELGRYQDAIDALDNAISPEPEMH